MKQSDHDNLNRGGAAAADLRAAGSTESTALDARLDALARDTVRMPSAAVWERVWTHVEAGVSAAETQRKRNVGRRAALPRIFRLWQPFAAAAACALMIGSWLLWKGPIGGGASESRGGNQITSMNAPEGDAIPWQVADDDWAIVLVSNEGSNL